MRVDDTELHGVKLIVPEAFKDHRGRYVELYDTAKYRGAYMPGREAMLVNSPS